MCVCVCVCVFATETAAVGREGASGERERKGGREHVYVCE